METIDLLDIVTAERQLQEIWKASPFNAPRLDEDGDASWGPVVVCASITRQGFNRWADDDLGRLKRCFFEPFATGSEKGRILVYSLPSLLHARATEWLRCVIALQAQSNGHDVFSLSWAGSAGWLLNNDSRQTVRPIDVEAIWNRSDCQKHVVVEVAYKNESLRNLRALLHRRMENPAIQVALGVKIFANSLRRVAVLLQRGSPMQEVECCIPAAVNTESTLFATVAVRGQSFRVCLNLNAMEHSIDLWELHHVMADELVDVETLTALVAAGDEDAISRAVSSNLSATDVHLLRDSVELSFTRALGTVMSATQVRVHEVDDSHAGTDNSETKRLFKQEMTRE